MARRGEFPAGEGRAFARGEGEPQPQSIEERYIPDLADPADYFRPIPPADRFGPLSKPVRYTLISLALPRKGEGISRF